MKKLTLLTSFFLFLFLLLPSSQNRACAQSASSSCVVTAVGNAGPSPTLPPNCNTGGSCMKPPDYPSDLRAAIISKFGVTFNGFDQEHLKWFWEELWNTSGTNFAKLASGATVESAFCPGGGNFSCMVGCGNPSIYFGVYQGEEFNKVLIVHELGHYIMGCKDEITQTYLPEFDRAFFAEGGITEYSRNANACTGSSGVSNHNEDFAETVTYFLHPFAQSQSIACAAGQPNPFYDASGKRTSAYPLHFSWAQRALGNFACAAQ